MSLYTNFADAGPGIVVAFSKRTRKYRVGDATDYQEFQETSVNETREWVALTYEAARAQCELNIQPLDATASYQWSMQERVRPVKSYSVTREGEKITTSVIGGTPTPTMVEPLYSPVGRTTITEAWDAVSSLNVGITNQTSGSTLHYRVSFNINPSTWAGQNSGVPWPWPRFQINGWDYRDSYANGFLTTTSPSVTVPIEGNGTGYRQYVRLSLSASDQMPPLRLAVVGRIESFSRITRQNPVTNFDSAINTKMFIVANQNW